MNTSSLSQWDCASTEIIYSLYQTLDREADDWRYIKPRLRLLNKHWKTAIDSFSWTLSLRDRSIPWQRKIRPLLEGKRLTSITLYPLYGSLFKLDDWRDITRAGTLMELGIHSVDNASIVFENLTELAKTLRKLKLLRCKLTQQCLNNLSQLSNIRELHMTQIDPAGDGECLDCQCISELTLLERLSIQDCGYSNNLEFIWTLPSLMSLDFCARDVDLPGPLSLHGLSSLSIQRKNKNVLSNFERLDPLTNIKSLTIDRERLSTYLRSSLPRLRHLSIETSEAVEMRRALKYTCRCKRHLKRIGEIFNWLSNQACALEFSTFCHFLPGSLICLELSDCCIDSRTFAYLPKLPNLKILRTSYATEINASPMPVHVVLPSLKIWTRHSSFTSTGSNVSVEMPNLERLGIVWTSVTTGCLLVDEEYPKLHDLSIVALDSTQAELVTNWDRKHDIARLPTLKHVGWRTDHTEEIAVPGSVVKEMTRAGILFDIDVRVFGDFNTVQALL